MSNTIEKLYEGKLEPIKSIGKGNGEMRRMENLILRNKKRLEEILDNDEKEILEKYVECMEEYMLLLGEQAFCDGFLFRCKNIVRSSKRSRTIIVI